MNRAYFFDRIRHSLFGGRLTKKQVEGITNILDYRENKWPNMPDAELAYVLATIKHETAHTMQPVKEYGGLAYLRSKPYYPWYGRGLVQITWKRNYDKFGIKRASDALKWDVALDVTYRGMIFGMFTGMKLSDYISDYRYDFTGARRIINGKDKAKLIAGYANAFLDAIVQSRELPAQVEEK